MVSKILDNIADVAREFESKTGAPPISKFTEAIEKFPGEKQLRLIKEVLVAANKISDNAPQLDQVVELIKEINSMPVEKIEKLEKLLHRIESILKKAPADLMGFLNTLKEE